AVRAGRRWRRHVGSGRGHVHRCPVPDRGRRGPRLGPRRGGSEDRTRTRDQDGKNGEDHQEAAWCCHRHAGAYGNGTQGCWIRGGADPVRIVRYGVAGLKDPKDLEGSIARVVEGGYAACEVQFVKEFTLKEPEAERLGTIAAREGVRLSVHAPYFAQLTTAEPERLTLHLGALHHSCHLAALMSSVEALRALFAYIAQQFSPQHLWPLHCHFTDNRFGPAGELTHVPYGEGTLRASNLAAAAADFDFALTIISEERWEESHRAI